MDRRLRIASAVAALVLGTMGGWLVSAGRSRAQRAADAAAEEVHRTAEQLGGRLDSAAQAAKLRAETLANMPVVRAAVETDAATLRDLARSDFVFRPGKNETLEFFQVAGARAVSLLRLPAGTRPLRLGARSVELTADKLALQVIAQAPVSPLYGEATQRGAIALSVRVELADLQERLRARGLDATLTGLDAPLLLAGTITIGPTPLRAELPHGLMVQAHLDIPPGGDRVRAGHVLLGLGLLLAIASLWRKRPIPIVHRKLSDQLPTSPLPLAWSSDNPPPLPLLVPSTSEAVSTHGESSDLVAGKFRVFRHLGAGSAADVYLAQLPDSSRVVALKVLRREFTTPPIVEQFLAGPRAASAIEHPNVARVLELGLADATVYVATEYIEGCSLDELLRDLRRNNELMPLRQSLKIAIGLCQGLYAGHALGLVHHDLKPSNVLVGRHGAIKLTDFGGPTTLGPGSDYQAPEQVMGERVDLRADVYAVGAILHELLTGSHLLLNRGEVMRAGRRAWPTLPRPSSLRPDLPEELDGVLGKALQFSAKRRPPCCRELAIELEQLLIAVDPAPSSRVLGDWVERVRHSN